MAFNVTEFKTNLTQGGARPSLFKVTLDYPSKIKNKPSIKSEFLIKGASIPTSTIGAYDVFFHGKQVKIAGDRAFETWDTTIINDEDFGIRIALEQWMDLIADHKLNTRSNKFTLKEGENADYKKSIKVTQFDKGGDELHHYHFLGAFPTSIAAIPLDWGTQEIEEYTVTWTYDRWMPGWATKHGLSSEAHADSPATTTETT